MKAQLFLSNLYDLLISRNWKLEDSATKYNVFVPPVDLDFEKSYKLFVYNKIENSDFENEAFKSLNLISQIYGEDMDELNAIVVEDRQILTLRVEKEDIINGKPTLPFFDKLIKSSKELLQEAANFAVLEKHHFFDCTEESERYLNYCRFLKNNAGSLVTMIQLPNKEEIKEKNLFAEPITGSQVNKQLLDVTNFVNQEIIGSNNFEPTDDFLLTNKKLVSVNVSDKLRALYKEIDYSDIELSLKGTKIIESAKTGGLNKEKVDSLTRFSKTVKEKLKDISENEVYAKIITLKSKDVDSDKNTITVAGKIKNVQSDILIPLNSEQIKQAAETFRNNRTIKIIAVFEKEKTQYKVKDLKELVFM